MLRFILAIVLGAVVIFIWSSVSWTAIGWRDDIIQPFPEHDKLTQLLEESQAGSGFYTFPPLYETMNPTPEQHAQWLKAHGDKPRGTLVFDADPPAEPMPPEMFLYSALGDLGTALFAAIIVAISGAASFGRRLIIVLAIGVIAAVRADFVPWIWWHSPDRLMMIDAADQLIRFALLGLVIAAIIRPKRTAAVAAD